MAQTHVRNAGVVMSAWASFSWQANCDGCAKCIALTTTRAEAQSAARSHRCA